MMLLNMQRKFLAVCFVALTFAACERAQSGITKNGLKWGVTYNWDSVAISWYEGTDTDVVIPSKIKRKPVVGIRPRAFYEKNLTSVIIPDSVIEIGSAAFSNNQLTSVSIPNSVAVIDKWAFQNNQLSSVSISNKVTLIEESAFAYNQIAAITIPDSVVSIGGGAFRYNQLSAITIPDNVVSIGGGAFRNNQITNVVIGKSVADIGNDAFSENQLTSVIIPDSVKNIGSRAFENNRLGNIIFPPNIVNVESDAFNGNQLVRDYGWKVSNGNMTITGARLYTDVQIPSHLHGLPVKIIDRNAFRSGTFEYSRYSDGEYFIPGRTIHSVTIPDTVTTIGTCAFAGNSLSEVVIPDSVTRLGVDAFYENPITRITIGNNVEIFEPSQVYSIFAFDDFGAAFALFYRTQGSKAGTYRYHNGSWSVEFRK
jgi:hypothetical protein